MGIFGTIRNLFRRSAPAKRGTVKSTPRSALDVWPVPSYGAAESVATVYRCVNILADNVASLPMRYMRRKGDIFVEDTVCHLHYLLNVQPCEYMSAVDFWRLVVQYMLVRGNAYIVPVYDEVTTDIARLALVNPSTVAHDTLTDIYTVNDVYAGVSGRFRESEIIHIKNYTRDGKTGISTLSFARTAVDIASTGDAEALDRLANGGIIRGVVGNDSSVRGFGEYQDEELRKTAVDLDSRFRNNERIVSLPGQVQFTQMSMSSADMQFLETRKFSVREICRFFGVHPSFVFDDTSNNYKSAEMANVAFLSNTLNPILRRIEVELTRKLIAPSLCCKRLLQFDRRGLYACDLDSRVKYQTQTISAGLYTVNEWRREENRSAVAGGDTVLVSANLKGISESAAPTSSEVTDGTQTDNNNKEDEE